MPRHVLLASAIAAATFVAILSPVCLAQKEATSQPASGPADSPQATAEKRAGDVLEALALSDQAKAGKVRSILVDFYVARINWGPNDEKMKSLPKDIAEATNADDKAKADELRGQLDALGKELVAMRGKLLADLAEVLTAEQIVTVKDVMTYKKLPMLMKSYTQKFSLNDAQQAVALKLLSDAREDAMMAGSAEDKHAIFNKAIGRVNIYVDSQKKLTEISAAIQAGKLDDAEKALAKLEKSKGWLKEATAAQIAEARKALDAAKASAPQTQPTKPAEG